MAIKAFMCNKLTLVASDGFKDNLSTNMLSKHGEQIKKMVLHAASSATKELNELLESR